MTNVPEPTQIEALNALTKGRPARSKWRAIGVLALTGLLLLGGAAAIVETHRQVQIDEARKELTPELDSLTARYADVHDWPAWYRARMPQNWGGIEFDAWSDRLNEVHARHPDVSNWSELIRDELFEIPERDEQVPSPEQLDALLADTDPLIGEAQLLLRFECLTPLPDLSGGLPSYDVIGRLLPIHVLEARIWVHASRSDWDRAWHELLLWQELGLRLNAPHAAADHLTSVGHSRMSLALAADLLQLHTPQREVLEKLATLTRLPPAPLARIAEGERAFMATIVRMIDDPALHEDAWLTEDCGTDTFSYLSPSLSWEQRWIHLTGAPEFIRAVADFYRVTRLLAEGKIDGPGALDINSPFASWVETSLQQSARCDILYDQVELMAQVRLAELDHNNPLPQALEAAARYPKLELTAAEKHWTLRVRFTSDVTAALFETWHSADDFYETHEPLKLPRNTAR